MNDEQTKKIIEDTCVESKEDTFCTMARDLYNKKNLATLIWVWGNSLVFLALAIFSCIKFFQAEQSKYQIMYAAIFICCSLSVGFCKAIAFVMVTRHNIKREIKRLEIRIAELNETVKNK